MSDVQHWSHSQVDAWLSCGKKYELSRLRGAPQSPTVWSPAGTALHEVADLINRGECDNIVAAWEETFDRHVQEQLDKTQVDPQFWRKAGRVTKDKPDKEDVRFWRSEGARHLAQYRHWLTTSGFEIVRLQDGTILSEHETTTRFGNVEVKGFCDGVFTAPDGRTIVVDIKSGSRMPDKLTQLGLYKVALHQNHDLQVDGGAFFMSRKGELTEIMDLSKYTSGYFEAIFAKAQIAREYEIFLPNPGSACFICDVKDACFTVGGTSSWKFDSLNPQFQPS